MSKFLLGGMVFFTVSLHILWGTTKKISKMKETKSESFSNNAKSIGEILATMFGKECFQNPDATNGAATGASINREQQKKARLS